MAAGWTPQLKASFVQAPNELFSWCSVCLLKKEAELIKIIWRIYDAKYKTIYLNFFHGLTLSHKTQNAYKISLVPSADGRDDENTITLGLLEHLG